MLTTSVSLPIKLSAVWRGSQRAIMVLAVRSLRVQMRGGAIRRGVKRRYNRMAGGFEIVTTRFTEAEYDTLHCAAAAMRVSVSWLVYQMILLWLKPARRKRRNSHLTNYVLVPLIWNENVGVFAESLWFLRKPKPQQPPEPHYSNLQRYC